MYISLHTVHGTNDAKMAMHEVVKSVSKSGKKVQCLDLNEKKAYQLCSTFLAGSWSQATPDQITVSVVS